MNDPRTEESRAYFTRAGMSTEQIDALYGIWGVPIFDMLLDDGTFLLRREGWQLHDLVEAAIHGIAHEDAVGYTGFSGHQAALCEASPQARHNLWSRDLENGPYPPPDIPSDYMTAAAIAAHSPAELDAYVDSFRAARDGQPDPATGAPRTAEEVAETVHALAAPEMPTLGPCPYTADPAAPPDQTPALYLPIPFFRRWFQE